MKFSFTENGAIRGPKKYMDERGSDLLEDILNDNDDQFSEYLRRAPSAKKAILVRLQTDYAGWKGQKEVVSKMLS